VVVIGHQAEAVKTEIGLRAKTAFQAEQLGTAHALGIGLQEIGGGAEHVLVMNADDSAFYKSDTIQKFIENHLREKPVISFMSVLRKAPASLGRVVKDENGDLIGIVEEKDATDDQKKIQEVNSGCFCFEKSWVSKNLSKIKITRVGEYYITDLVKLALDEGEPVRVFKIENEAEWMGINTPEEFKKAQKELERKNEC